MFNSLKGCRYKTQEGDNFIVISHSTEDDIDYLWGLSQKGRIEIKNAEFAKATYIDKIDITKGAILRGREKDARAFIISSRFDSFNIMHKNNPKHVLNDKPVFAIEHISTAAEFNGLFNLLYNELNPEERAEEPDHIGNIAGVLEGKTLGTSFDRRPYNCNLTEIKGWCKEYGVKLNEYVNTEFKYSLEFGGNEIFFRNVKEIFPCIRTVYHIEALFESLFDIQGV